MTSNPLGGMFPDLSSIMGTRWQPAGISDAWGSLGIEAMPTSKMEGLVGGALEPIEGIWESVFRNQLPVNRLSSVLDAVGAHQAAKWSDVALSAALPSLPTFRMDLPSVGLVEELTRVPLTGVSMADFTGLAELASQLQLDDEVTEYERLNPEVAEMSASVAIEAEQAGWISPADVGRSVTVLVMLFHFAVAVAIVVGTGPAGAILGILYATMNGLGSAHSAGRWVEGKFEGGSDEIGG